MKRHLLTIKYDGSAYCGWQVQPNGISVQGTVQEALKKLTKEDDLRVTGCSRTDSGVHAEMFCLHFDSNTLISDDKIPFAVNVLLPDDIVALKCKSVDSSFHARYSARGKTYIYKIFNSPLPDPFKYKYFLRVNYHINEKVVNEACKCFIGTHDFCGFCSSGSSVANTVRTVTQCEAYREGNDVFIKITANGFLYNMVRIIVGTLLDINNGKIDINKLPGIIDSGDRSKAGATVKPHGLYLEEVYY